MIITVNNNPIRIIGYPESSMTQEFVNEITKTHTVEIVQPNNFLSLPNQNNYQYIIAVSVDLEERKKLIEHVDQKKLDLITVISDTSLVGSTPVAIIHPGTFISPFCNISIASTIGRHCIVGSYSLIGHYASIGNNCILRPGVMITGKSTVGHNCIINTRSTVTNNSTVADNVEIKAFTNVVKNIIESGKYIGSTARRQPDL
jgi:UDP-3-O-[3-hydroxymyristoyl] glucosamine N-acyltransferase